MNPLFRWVEPAAPSNRVPGPDRDPDGEPATPASTIPHVWTALELTAGALATWTLIYHAWLLLGWSARSALWVLHVIAAAAVAAIWIRRRRVPPPGAQWSPAAVTAWSLAAALGLTTLFISRPDLDDFNFFHRALVQVGRPSSPFSFGDTSHNVPGLPLGSFVHSTVSYEYLVSLLADSVGLDPLWAYQNLACLVAAALVPLAYVAVAEELGLRGWRSVALAAAAVLFLLLDGNTHRSFGNFAFVRLWQGKCILVTLLLPVALAFALRFFRRPNAPAFLWLCSLSVVGVGLTGSAVFLIPALLLAVSAALLAVNTWSAENLRAAILVNVAGAYCTLLGLGIVTGLTPLPADSSIWETDLWWPTHWWDNLDLVIGGTAGAVRDASILLLLPLVSLPPRHAVRLVVLTGVLCAMFVNPVLGPLVMGYLLPGAFWRLMYLFPLAACAGLLAVGWSPAAWRTRRGLVRIAVSIAVVASCAVANERTTLAEPVRWKSPSEYKLPEGPVRFVLGAREHLRNRNLIVADEMSVAALLEPSIRFEVSRGIGTHHVFSYAGYPEEGRRRWLAQKVVMGSRAPRALQAFRTSLERGVDAVITRSRQGAFLEQVLAAEPGTWKRMHEAEGFVLFLRQPGDSRSGAPTRSAARPPVAAPAPPE
jgi:hypothetical protein